MNIHTKVCIVSGGLFIDVQFGAKAKLHVQVETLISPRFLEGTMITYLYSYFL